MRVRVHAVGLNPIDTMISKGTFQPVLPFRLPATMGSEVAGVVVEVGPRVTRFRPGDAVFAGVFDLGRGTLTSWQALKERIGLRAGLRAAAERLRRRARDDAG